MVDVGLYQDGRKLELAEGMPAHVTLANITEGDIDRQAIDSFNDTYADTLGRYTEPTIPLWHFNYDTTIWDRVEDEDWKMSNGTQEGYLNLDANVPAFSPANPDDPPVVCTNSIDVVQPDTTCVCKNVKHANDTEAVRGSSISLLSRARAYTYLVTQCSNGASSRVLVGSRMQTWFQTTTTDGSGNFCGNAIIDPLSKKGSVRIDSTKTYWPGRLDSEDIQYKDVDHDGSMDDDHDGKVDSENAIGYLGDTYIDVWTRALSGVRSCGAPDEVIHVECQNEPTDPVTGSQPN
jgi:hypothetical protein